MEMTSRPISMSASMSSLQFGPLPACSSVSDAEATENDGLLQQPDKQYGASDGEAGSDLLLFSVAAQFV